MRFLEEWGVVEQLRNLSGGCRSLNDNNVVFMGKKYQDVKNEKVEKLGAQTRSKSSGIPPVKNFEDKSYKLAVISPKKNNSANGRNFTVLKRETSKSE